MIKPVQDDKYTLMAIHPGLVYGAYDLQRDSITLNEIWNPLYDFNGMYYTWEQLEKMWFYAHQEYQNGLKRTNELPRDEALNADLKNRPWDNLMRHYGIPVQKNLFRRLFDT